MTLKVDQGHWRWHNSISNKPHITSISGLCLSLYPVSFLRYSMSNKGMPSKSGLAVTQCHWKWHHSIDCMVFSVDDKVLIKSLYQFSVGLVQTFNKNFIVSIKNHVYTMPPWRYNSDVENTSFPSFHFRAL